MDFWEKISQIDRRIIYMLLALVIVVPLITQAKSRIRVSPHVQSAYDAVEGLPERAVVMISIDYDAASMPELQPMLKAILRHCFKRRLRVLLIVQWPLGAPLGTMGLEEVAKETGAEYGVDYVNLGYRPGYIAQMVGLGREIRDYFEVDYRGTPLDSLPMMDDIHNYNDIDLLVGLEAGATGDAWVQYAGARFGQKIFLGVTAVSAPDAYPYLQSGQIVGLLGGLKGAAEYEVLTGHPDIAVTGMTAQSWGHALIIFFIILGNIGFFVVRRRKKGV